MFAPLATSISKQLADERRRDLLRAAEADRLGHAARAGRSSGSVPQVRTGSVLRRVVRLLVGWA